MLVPFSQDAFHGYPGFPPVMHSLSAEVPEEARPTAKVYRVMVGGGVESGRLGLRCSLAGCCPE